MNKIWTVITEIGIACARVISVKLQMVLCVHVLFLYGAFLLFPTGAGAETCSENSVTIDVSSERWKNNQPYEDGIKQKTEEYIKFLENLDRISYDQNIEFVEKNKYLFDLILNRYAYVLLIYQTDDLNQRNEFKEYFTKFSEFNEKFCVFEKENFVLSALRYKFYALSENNIYARNNRVRSLRSIVRSLWSPVYIERYVSELSQAERFIQSKEVEFWDDYFQQSICDSGEAVVTCLDKITNKLESQEISNYDSLLENFLCSAKIIHNNKLYSIELCAIRKE